MQALTYLTSLAGGGVLLQSLLPSEYKGYIHLKLLSLLEYVNPYCFVRIPEFDGTKPNALYSEVQAYMGTCTAAANRINLTRSRNGDTAQQTIAENEMLSVNFRGAAMTWTHHVSVPRATIISWQGAGAAQETRYYNLRMARRHRKLLDEYMAHVRKEGKVYERSTRKLQLYTNTSNDRKGQRMWEEFPFKHPASLDTVAMDPADMAAVRKDLDRFVQSAEVYRKAGRAHKRGYFLYGPPGTGKSSLVAAMANHLNFDLYDLELTEVRTNAQLRSLLVQVKDRSILVIEDIDCTISDLEQRPAGRPNRGGRGEGRGDGPDSMRGPKGEDESRVTLSGLLNFTDGLWSSCGSQRIIVFTTNHPEKLDQALLRAGRMDMKIHMSWCRGPAFRVLCRNYLGDKVHPDEAEIAAILDKVDVSPAELAGALMQYHDDPELAMAAVRAVIKQQALTVQAGSAVLPHDSQAGAKHDSSSAADMMQVEQ
ncbi:hypothetical protein WJX72_001281 [[Myrmecia] bisecta]|uniref:AAA+ ATPase domain-containing protein n=1 Tax=[Myrmecia] bisecta TaxID=41462 RepID=A0AAW1Q112_9CHLO